MKRWDNFISEISDEDFKIMFQNYDHLEKYASIGDCPLRSKAEEWGDIIGADYHVVMVMRDIVFEGYRRFFKKFVDKTPEEE